MGARHRCQISGTSGNFILLESAYPAVDLFKEDGPGYSGKRLYLEKLTEEMDTPRLNELKRRALSPESDAEKGHKFLVIFKITDVLPLIGGDEDA
mgnify:CR=1 FL=1